MWPKLPPPGFELARKCGARFRSACLTCRPLMAHVKTPSRAEEIGPRPSCKRPAFVYAAAWNFAHCGCVLRRTRDAIDLLLRQREGYPKSVATEHIPPRPLEIGEEPDDDEDGAEDEDGADGLRAIDLAGSGSDNPAE